MPWRLRAKRNNPISVPIPPRLPNTPRLPKPPKPLRPAKPPALPGYEFYWSDK